MLSDQVNIEGRHDEQLRFQSNYEGGGSSMFNNKVPRGPLTKPEVLKTLLFLTYVRFSRCATRSLESFRGLQGDI